MVEGGIQKADKTEFTECWRTSWKTPYIMRLALSAGIGGLLFGYDTGVISGALLYIRDDFRAVDSKIWLQETIVSMAVAGAIVGAALGGWMNDFFGRRISIMVADTLFALGAIVMACAPAPWVIIIGRIFVGLGVGMASMTSPLYISEASPARIRGALVSTNGLLITGGQFLSYCINLAFTRVKGTWRWMLGVAAVPAIVQFFLMLCLPESPRWLYRKDRKEEAEAILHKIYSPAEVQYELSALQESIEAEKAEEEIIGKTMKDKLKGAFSNRVVRRGLYAGITVQVAQQFSGINTVMYYSPTIVQFAGFASKKTAMALSLITSGLNVVGSIISMAFVDRYGRRRLMMVSMMGIIACLVVLSVLFFEAASHAPRIDDLRESTHFASNATCQAYASAVNPSAWNCMNCLSAGCGFCASANQYAPGACLALTDDLRKSCSSEHRTWFKYGCPSKFGFFAVILLGFYIVVYSPGMGTVPWIVNSEIAAVSNWVANLIVSESFLSLTKALGSSGTFLLFAGVCLVGLCFIYCLVPETKGMKFEEVEKMLESGYKPKLFRRKSKEPEIS